MIGRSCSPSITENIKTSSILLHLVVAAGLVVEEQAVVEVAVAAVEPVVEERAGVAAVRPVVVSEEPEKTDFSFRSTRILMSTVWARTETRLRHCRHRKAMMMSFVPVTAGFMAWERISDSE